MKIDPLRTNRLYRHVFATVVFGCQETFFVHFPYCWSEFLSPVLLHKRHVNNLIVSFVFVCKKVQRFMWHIMCIFQKGAEVFKAEKTKLYCYAYTQYIVNF